MAPEGVGESTTRRGEDVVKEEGKEPGREDTGTHPTPAERPTGESSPRDSTAVKTPGGSRQRSAARALAFPVV